MRSIAARLTMAYVGSLLLMMSLALFVGSQLVETHLVEASDALVDSEFSRVRSHLLEGPPTTDPAQVAKRLTRLTNNIGNLIYVEVRHRDGRLLFLSQNLHLKQGAVPLPLMPAKRYRAPVSQLGEMDISRYEIAPFYDVVVAISRHPILSAMRSYFELFVGMLAVILLVGAATGYFLSQLSLRPLRGIQDACMRISLETLDERIPVSSVNDELSTLARLLNAMLDRLDASVSQVRRFTSDASHELKTPLTLLRLQVDRLLDDETLSATHREALEEMTADMTQLQQTINSLLLLSRVDSNTLPVNMLAQSPLAFLQGFQGDATAYCRHYGCRFVLEHHGDGETVFDGRWLRQVLLNLLSNAVRASPEHGVVLLRSTLDRHRWTVAMEDEGPGLPADQRSRIFERFVRSSTYEEGSGLGLAICRSIIQLHGGEIRAVPRTDGTGLSVSFWLSADEKTRLLAAGPSVSSLKGGRRRDSGGSVRKKIAAGAIDR